jgi:polysaccharide pyruvyl transferase WcaK-like protein
MMVSSRYHGIVTSMPGLVASAGITMDERIRNLMRERGHQDLLMNVEDQDLEPKLLAAMHALTAQRERIIDGIGRCVVKNLRAMARMGVYFEEEVQRRYPDFPTRKGEYRWEDYLPPLSPSLRQLLETYDDSSVPSMVAD